MELAKRTWSCKTSIDSCRSHWIQPIHFDAVSMISGVVRPTLITLATMTTSGTTFATPPIGLKTIRMDSLTNCPRNLGRVCPDLS